MHSIDRYAIMYRMSKELDPRSKKLIAGSLTISVLGFLVAGLSYSAKQTSPEHSYGTEYTANGKCLDGKLYDKDSGALININTVGKTDVLSVMPRDANYQDPSVLFFTVNSGSNPLSKPKLSPADFATAGFLANSCPDQPLGL